MEDYRLLARLDKQSAGLGWPSHDIVRTYNRREPAAEGTRRIASYRDMCHLDSRLTAPVKQSIRKTTSLGWRAQ